MCTGSSTRAPESAGHRQGDRALAMRERVHRRRIAGQRPSRSHRSRRRTARRASPLSLPSALPSLTTTTYVWPGAWLATSNSVPLPDTSCEPITWSPWPADEHLLHPVRRGAVALQRVVADQVRRPTRRVDVDEQRRVGGADAPGRRCARARSGTPPRRARRRASRSACPGVVAYSPTMIFGPLRLALSNSVGVLGEELRVVVVEVLVEDVHRPAGHRRRRDHWSLGYAALIAS